MSGSEIKGVPVRPIAMRCRPRVPASRARVVAPAAAALAVLALGALAGCGKSGPPSKAQYIQSANRVCASEKGEMDRIALTSRDLASAIDESNQVRAQTAAKLAALKKPADQAPVSEWLSARAAALTAAQQVSLHTSSKAANRAYFRANNNAERLARGYGLTSCVGFASS